MKIIESFDVMESFGMSELTVDDLFDVDGGFCIFNFCSSKGKPCTCKTDHGPGPGPDPCSCNGKNLPTPCSCNGGTNQCIGTSYGC